MQLFLWATGLTYRKIIIDFPFQFLYIAASNIANAIYGRYILLRCTKNSRSPTNSVLSGILDKAEFALKAGRYTFQTPAKLIRHLYSLQYDTKRRTLNDKVQHWIDFVELRYYVFLSKKKFFNKNKEEAKWTDN
jgi:hypothetical protein